MSKETRRRKLLIILVAWTIGYWLFVIILSLLAGSDLFFWSVAVASYLVGLVLTVYNLKERKTTMREVQTRSQ